MASMLQLACVLLIVLATAVQCRATSSGTSFTFNVSQVTQCAPVSISFSGMLDNDNIPTTITLLPSDAQAFYIDLPTSSLRNTSTQIDVTFLPLPANTTFLLSLDRHGKSVAPVSGFLTVGPSGDSTCLASTTLPSPDIYQVSQNISSCQPLSVTYNSSLIPKAPQIRLYQPGQNTSLVNLVPNQSVVGNAIYVLPSVSKKSVLLIDGGNALTQTLTVQNSANLTTLQCSDGVGQNTIDMSMPTSNSSKSPTIGTIVGMSIAIAVVVLCGITMVAFVVRERRRYKRAMMSFSLIGEKREKPLPAIPAVDPHFSVLEITALNLPHVSGRKDYNPFGFANQSNANKVGAQWRNSLSQGSQSPSTQPASLDWLDIERMLDMATLRSDQTETQSKPSTAQTSFLVLPERNSSEERATLDSPGYILPLTAARLQIPPPSAFPFRRHSPMDVPKDLTPVRLSFSSASVAANSPNYNGRFMGSLVFEGLDDSSSQRSGFIPDARSRKLVEEKPFTIRKKVILADDVGDSDDQGEERTTARVDKRKGLMVQPSIAGDPGSHLDRWWKTL